MSPSRLALMVRIALLCMASATVAQKAPASLEEGFKNPPNSAKPRVWWHWMNGNITKEGIKLDLEWMNRVGIDGFQNFEASLSPPQLVDQRLVYMTRSGRTHSAMPRFSPINWDWRKQSLDLLDGASPVGRGCSRVRA